ncbi:MAG: TIGR04282 family arsenosugar biosynthesis glycosyltransferase [Parafilimonas sp.]
MKQALIIFQKNPVYGKVKTRLAATIGNDEALAIYRQLIQHTHLITHELKADKIVFYSDVIDEDDNWNNEYLKQLQKGNDLGERMMNAFNYVFQKHFSNAIIIGTDCAELDELIILNAFDKLNEYDVVIGPSADGGYYLLGMKEITKHLFTAIEWSTNKVLNTTIERCRANNRSYFLLKELHDIDEEKDLAYMKVIQ